MSHIEFKKEICPMPLHFYPSCRMSLSPISHVELRNAHVALSILGVNSHLNAYISRVKLSAYQWINDSVVWARIRVVVIVAILSY